MSQTTVIRLIHSLSKAEKRQFKLFLKRQSCDKDYMDLFDMIDQKNLTDKTLWKKGFKKGIHMHLWTIQQDIYLKYY